MKKPQKKIRVSSSYPNQSEPLHNLFRVFALLNLRLHRRVKLLVLESSLLEFRVLVISCHAAAAPSSSPCHLPPPLIRHRSESVSIYHHQSVSKYHHRSVSIYHHRYHIPPPLPYPTTIYPPPIRVLFILGLMRTSIPLLHPQPLLLHMMDQLLELAHAN